MHSYNQNQYWRDVDPNSTMTKVEHTYWITKQNVLKKMGKKEDECITASDAELDAKLELFRSIQESCLDLQKIVDRYQDRFCCVAQEENAMGRFLKESGGTDTTRAGKMMINVGKAMSYCGKQRLTLRPPLLRLGQEVETFRLRAIADTLANVKEMEKARVEYRAGLRWMKDVSQELDPERQLDKFRKVQAQVRRSKTRFDQLKLDCLQKVDLLAAARCNMFSHALVLYHKTLLEFCEKAAHAFQAVASTCKGYQHYEFNIVKELTEPSLKLAEQLNANTTQAPDREQDSDVLLFFDTEFRDVDPKDTKSEDNKVQESDSENLQPPSETLLDMTPLSLDSMSKGDDPSAHQSPFDIGPQSLDLASSMQLLEGLYQSSDTNDNWSREWDDVFGGGDSPSKSAPRAATSSASPSCFPSSLLDHSNLWEEAAKTVDSSPSPLLRSQSNQPNSLLQDSKLVTNKKEDMMAWFNLFADLDPLGDPDAVGAKSIADRNC